LIPVNCGGIPETLMESELFGHLKGAFTGADKTRSGLFVEADGGTIFLDEIGELPLTLQIKLLRVLQENEVRPVGGARPSKINVRVIAATSKDLKTEILNGNFREDLYYRLNVMPIQLPPLRDRREDIPDLCDHFIEKFNRSMQKAIRGVSADAMAMLLEYGWPGNVRELENLIERSAVLADEDLLLKENFPPELTLLHSSSNDFDHLHIDGFSLKAASRSLEKQMIIRALKATDGNRTRACQLLEISHPSLLSKIKAYNIAE